MLIVDGCEFCNRSERLEVGKGKDGTRQENRELGGPCSMNGGGCLGSRYVPLPTGPDNKIPDIACQGRGSHCSPLAEPTITLLDSPNSRDSTP